MKRRISRSVSILLALCLALALLPGTVLAVDRVVYPNGYTLYFEPSTGTITLITSSAAAEVVIPSEINGVPVTAIGDEAAHNGLMTSVTIPDSVTSIGEVAFARCGALTSVTIGNGVTSIGYGAFMGCSLTSVTIPDSVITIGDHAFSANFELTSLTIGNSVTSIGEFAFSNCFSLTGVTIPSSVTFIGTAPFNSCSSLTGINVESGNPAYSSVDGVLFNADQTVLYSYPRGKTASSYSIPASVTAIGDNAFSTCDNLTSVTIPDSVTSIGYGAFMSCSSLSSVTIPDGVTTIGKSTFNGCNSLTSVTIPESVTSIESYAFYSCHSLTDVYYSGSESQWEQIAIDNAVVDYLGVNPNAPLLGATIHYSGAAPTPSTDPAPSTSESIPVFVNGAAVAWTDAEPFIDNNGRTMVPLRAVADAMGLEVNWDENTREASFTGSGKTIIFPIDSSTARTSEGGTVTMDTAAVIVNERTYAPIRYLAEFFGYTVGWDETARTVSITA